MYRVENRMRRLTKTGQAGCDARDTRTMVGGLEEDKCGEENRRKLSLAARSAKYPSKSHARDAGFSSQSLVQLLNELGLFFFTSFFSRRNLGEKGKARGYTSPIIVID